MISDFRVEGWESPSLVALMRMTYEEWDGGRGACGAAGGVCGLPRNVAVAIGNWLASVDEPPAEAAAVLRDALKDGDPLVREHAAWALNQADRA